MRLLHIIATMDPASGGPCQGIRNSNPEVQRSGILREVVTLDAPDAPFLGKDDFPIHALGPAKGPWQHSPDLKPWLMKHLSRFDAVVINGLWLYPSFAGWSAVKALKQKKKKDSSVNVPRVYVMPHGMLDPYFQLAPERRIKAIRNWFYWQFIERKVVNDADGLLFTCETELLLARKTFSPYKPKREINVGYGIIPPPEFTLDMQHAFLAKCPKVSTHPYLLFFSRIHPKKGVDLLINAYSAIARRCQEDGEPFPKLVVAGPGLDTPFGKKILKSAAQPHLRDHVYFPGMLTGNAKWGALYGAEAFVLPSHQENFGIAVVEAMACKKAVLISDQVNIWQEISNGGGGIVGSDTLHGAREVLNTWMEMPRDEKEKMCSSALNIYQESFHIGPASAAFIRSIAD